MNAEGAAGGPFDPRSVVARKRDGWPLSDREMAAFVIGYARGEVPDYLAAAFLMACYLNGLTTEETVGLTRAMIDSGVTLPLPSVSRPRVDKHSTGGVSDGVTLVFAPLAASLGLAVPKLSGRWLGHTGGTLDKLESIPGLRTDLTPEELERQIEAIGCAVAGQSRDLVPADGALYALREATATIDSIPLIAASVMSKKLAVDTDLILLDVKVGSGAFMKTPGAADELAVACVNLASLWGRAARAAVTDMSQPLGSAIGNALDVAEAVRVLRGEQEGRLRELSVTFAAEALALVAGVDREEARQRAAGALDDGAAASAFARMVQAQGGDPRVVDDPDDVLPGAPIRLPVLSPAGYVAEVDGEALGQAAVFLGAGRVRKGDPVDPAVGIELHAHVGDHLDRGEPLATVHARTADTAEGASAMIVDAVRFAPEPVEPPPLLYAWHGQAEVEVPERAPRANRRHPPAT